MADYKKELIFERYQSLDDLPRADADLMKQAIKAAETAYAPYSNFKVGAALLLDDESIVLGSNQENAAFSSCICAERVALTSKAVNNANSEILSIAVVSFLKGSNSPHPATPCGECRQMIAEYQNRQKTPIRIIMQVERELILIAPSIESLLPFLFDGDQLK